MIRIITIVYLMVLATATLAGAAPVGNRLIAPAAKTLKPTVETVPATQITDTLQQQFSITNSSVPLKIAFAATTPGAVYVDVVWKGTPISVSLQHQVTKTTVAAVPGTPTNARLTYVIQPSDIQKGYYWDVIITSNAPCSGIVRIISPKADQALLTKALAIKTLPATLPPPGIKRPTTSSTPPASNQPPAAPTISTIRPLNKPSSSSFAVFPGDTVVVTGTELSGLSSAVLHYAVASNGTFVPSTTALKNYPVTPTESIATGFKFIIPANMPVSGTGDNFILKISRGAQEALSPTTFIIATRPTDRKITRVEQTAVMAGGRIKIYGTGFDGTLAYSGVTKGYFGNGTFDTASNPAFSVANRGPDYVELWLPPTCDQEGILMLTSPESSGTVGTVIAQPPIIVGCAQNIPSGRILGSENLPNKTLVGKPGSTVTIEGNDLRYVTRVKDQRGQSYPFTFNKAGSGLAIKEQLVVTLPQTTGIFIGFTLEHRLPVQAVGTVTGNVEIPAAPVFSSMAHAWAMPGNMETISGSNLSSGGQKPTVLVGTAPATVTDFTVSYINFRIPAGATGPVTVQTAGGSVTATGPYQLFTGTYETAPGFYIMNGPTVITSIQPPTPQNNTITVTGQNMAQAGGICVKTMAGSPTPVFTWLRRVDYDKASNRKAVNNTEMKVDASQAPYLIKGSEIQVYGAVTPANDYSVGTMACIPGSSSLTWN